MYSTVIGKCKPNVQILTAIILVRIRYRKSFFSRYPKTRLVKFLIFKAFIIISCDEANIPLLNKTNFFPKTMFQIYYIGRKKLSVYDRKCLDSLIILSSSLRNTKGTVFRFNIIILSLASFFSSRHRFALSGVGPRPTIISFNIYYVLGVVIAKFCGWALRHFALVLVCKLSSVSIIKIGVKSPFTASEVKFYTPRID